MLYPDTRTWIMSNDLLESYIRQYIEQQNVDTISFVWQGGEPTLAGLDFFERVMALQRTYQNGKRIENSIQTNGILLDETWCEFLKQNGFLVGISIDGPKPFHDTFRKTASGESVFDQVIHGIELLRQYDVAFNTLTTLNRSNSHEPLAVYQFLKQIGSTFMQFIPIVEWTEQSDGHQENGALSVTKWSVEPDQFGTFLCSIFDEWVRNDVGMYFVQYFDVALERWFGVPASLCLFAETCGLAPAIEHNGDVYACDHYVSPEYKLGNIQNQSLDSMVFSKQQNEFAQAKKDTLPMICQQCPYLFACQGECPKNRFPTSKEGQPGLNYLCEGYKQFFSHIDPYMRFMANELTCRQSPAHVMSWAKSKSSPKM